MQTLTSTLTTSDIQEFIDEQLDLIASEGLEIPDTVYASLDVYKHIVKRTSWSPHSLIGASSIVFVTVHGELRLKVLTDKTDYLAVGGRDYVSIKVDDEIEKQFLEDN